MLSSVRGAFPFLQLIVGQQRGVCEKICLAVQCSRSMVQGRGYGLASKSFYLALDVVFA